MVQKNAVGPMNSNKKKLNSYKLIKIVFTKHILNVNKFLFEGIFYIIFLLITKNLSY